MAELPEWGVCLTMLPEGREEAGGVGKEEGNLGTSSRPAEKLGRGVVRDKIKRGEAIGTGGAPDHLLLYYDYLYLTAQVCKGHFTPASVKAREGVCVVSTVTDCVVWLQALP